MEYVADTDIQAKGALVVGAAGVALFLLILLGKIALEHTIKHLLVGLVRSRRQNKGDRNERNTEGTIVSDHSGPEDERREG